MKVLFRSVCYRIMSAATAFTLCVGWQPVLSAQGQQLDHQQGRGVVDEKTLPNAGMTKEATTKEWNTSVLMTMLGKVEAADLTFTEQRTSTFLVEKIELTGKMVYRAPDRIEKHVEFPFVENIKINGDVLSIEKISNRGESTYKTYSLAASEALGTAVEGIRATLAGNLDSLRSNYDIEMTGSMAEWSVELVPLRSEVRDVIEKIHVRGTDGKIRVIETHDADGDESRLTLSYQMIR